MNVCIKKRQLIRSILLALMFMIHPGMMAPVATEYRRISQAHLLPVISSKRLPPYEESLYGDKFTLFSFETGRTQWHLCWNQYQPPSFDSHAPLSFPLGGLALSLITSNEKLSHLRSHRLISLPRLFFSWARLWTLPHWKEGWLILVNHLIAEGLLIHFWSCEAMILWVRSILIILWGCSLKFKLGCINIIQIYW